MQDLSNPVSVTLMTVPPRAAGSAPGSQSDSEHRLRNDESKHRECGLFEILWIARSKSLGLESTQRRLFPVSRAAGTTCFYVESAPARSNIESHRQTVRRFFRSGRADLQAGLWRMSDATSKKIVQMLKSHPEPFVRTAAARLLAELALKDQEVLAALQLAVDDDEQTVRLEAIRGLGKLGATSALARLIDFIKQGGPESEAAADAAAQLGGKAVKSLQELMHHVAPGLRRRIAGSLAASGGAAAHSAGIQALLDSDPGVVDAATRSLLSKIPNFKAAEKQAVGDLVLEALAPRKGQKLGAIAEAALLRVLAGLHDTRSEKIFWARLDGANPDSVRAAALQALGGNSLSVKKDQLNLLLSCATSANFGVAAPALLLLKMVEPTPQSLAAWVSLFDAADPSARRFALEKLGTNETPVVIDALRRQLRHADRQLREIHCAIWPDRRKERRRWFKNCSQRILRTRPGIWPER